MGTWAPGPCLLRRLTLPVRQELPAQQQQQRQLPAIGRCRRCAAARRTAPVLRFAVRRSSARRQRERIARQPEQAVRKWMRAERWTSAARPQVRIGVPPGQRVCSRMRHPRRARIAGQRVSRAERRPGRASPARREAHRRIRRRRPQSQQRHRLKPRDCAGATAAPRPSPPGTRQTDDRS